MLTSPPLELKACVDDVLGKTHKVVGAELQGVHFDAKQRDYILCSCGQGVFDHEHHRHLAAFQTISGGSTSRLVWTKGCHRMGSGRYDELLVCGRA